MELAEVVDGPLKGKRHRVAAKMVAEVETGFAHYQLEQHVSIDGVKYVYRFQHISNRIEN